MHLLIVAAVSHELRIIKQEVKKHTCPGLKISFVCTGMGMYETIHTLTQKLEKETFDFVRNIGVCGFRRDAIMAHPAFFQVSRILNIHSGKELIVPPFVHVGPLRGIYCSEAPVLDSSVLVAEEFVDMESFAVEFVAQKYKIPRLLCKVPVDVVGEETKQFNREKALLLLQREIPYQTILSIIRLYCEKQKQPDSYARLRSHLRVSHRSFEILCDLIRAYEVLSENKFHDIFAQQQWTDAKKLQGWLEAGIASMKV
jgi:hypothetical protein